MAIAPIGASIAAQAITTEAPVSTTPAGGHGFGDLMAKAIDGLQGMQGQADGLATAAATGDLSDVHDYMIAATKASIATELTVAVRNRAVDAFNEIMRMQI